ncbi:MAG: gephyrin-like molybdotransferase Glp [Methylophilaceae bacterium]
MNKKITLKNLAEDHGCLAEYDPNAMDFNSANKYINKFLEPIAETQLVLLKNTLDRTLAEDLVSPINVPNYDNSAMDGFAFQVISASSSNKLEIVDTILAGKVSNNIVQKNQAFQIMTGGKIPQGADTVIPIELVIKKENVIILKELPKKGANIRKIGEDVQQGQIVLKKGTHIRPAEVGLIASLGIEKILVYRKLKVAFFSTGDEIIKVGTPIKSGQVYDSNHYTIHSMLIRLNIDCVDLGVIPDDKKIIETTLLKASRETDAIITSGGVSVGQADYVKEILEKIGSVLFWKLSIKPGRPMAYGKINSTPYFGLPGNPVATMVTFYQLVQPALKNIMGEKNYSAPPLMKVKCSVTIIKKPGRLEFQRGILFNKEGEWKVKPVPLQGSAILSSMSQANCFIILDINSGSIKSGEVVEVQIMNGLI